MIGYILLGTNDLERAGVFYDAVLGLVGGKRMMEMERMIAWSAGEDLPGIGVCLPYDKESATAGNGTMLALKAGSAEQVDAIHARVLELGGADEGAPGDRGGNFYAAYFRDLDGNKLAVFTMPEE